MSSFLITLPKRFPDRRLASDRRLLSPPVI